MIRSRGPNVYIINRTKYRQPILKTAVADLEINHGQFTMQQLKHVHDIYYTEDRAAPQIARI